MKSVYFLWICLLVSCKSQVGDDKGIIQFNHTGIVRHITNPLYISTRQIHIHLNKEQLNNLRTGLGDSTLVTPEKEKEYITAKFDVIVTDSKSFCDLSTFIINNDKFYTTNSHKNNNPTEDSYTINLNGKRYSIYYKFKKEFFYQLKNSLIKRNSDPNVIKAISFLN